MFGVNSSELVVIALLAALLLGPDRLPDLARQAGGLVRRGREFARQAQAQMREEIGPEFDEVDWKRYDPRQYHPRRIVQNALSDTFDDEPAPRSRSAARTGSTSASGSGASGSSRSGSSATAKPSSSTADRATASRVAGSARSAAATPRRASPPPSSWGDAARVAGIDPDAT